MRFLAFLSYLCLFQRLIFHVSSDVANDGNLFFDSDSDAGSDSLFPDNSSLLGGDIGEAASEPSSLLGEPISTGLDWAEPTDPVNFAESSDLCKIAQEVQYTGRIRARGDANSCSSADQTTNLLQLPGLSDLENSINGMGRRPKQKPQAFPYPPPLILAPTPQDENPCVPPWPIHLCCIYPEWDKMVNEFGFRVYSVVRECKFST